MDITRYMDLSFKPIPRHSPIPPNGVACVHGTYDTPDIPDPGTTFIICKNKQELLIEGPPLREIPGIEHMSDRDRSITLEKRFEEYLTIIEDLIPTIEFGITGFSHLVPDPLTDGYQIILDYEKQLRQVSCPTWAPIIPFEEVEFTVWGPLADRRGIWKGKEVDIFYAYDDLNMWRLNRAMYGYRRIDGLDFTYEVYGHLADRDGKIVGLVTEAAWGRPIKASDKELISSELKRLERFGCIYGGCMDNQLMIADGKLRIIQPIAIRSYSDPELLKRRADLCHSEMLELLFKEFEEFGPFGKYRLPPAVFIGYHKPITHLRHPIPRSPSLKNMEFLQYYQRSGFRAAINYADDLLDFCYDNNQPKRFVAPRPRKGRRNNLRLEYSQPNRNNGTEVQDEDVPLSSASRLCHRVFVSVIHPYARPTSVRPTKPEVSKHRISESTENDADAGTRDISVSSGYYRPMICYD